MHKLCWYMGHSLEGSTSEKKKTSWKGSHLLHHLPFINAKISSG